MIPALLQLPSSLLQLPALTTASAQNTQAIDFSELMLAQPTPKPAGIETGDPSMPIPVAVPTTPKPLALESIEAHLPAPASLKASETATAPAPVQLPVTAEIAEAAPVKSAQPSLADTLDSVEQMVASDAETVAIPAVAEALPGSQPMIPPTAVVLPVVVSKAALPSAAAEDRKIVAAPAPKADQNGTQSAQIWFEIPIAKSAVKPALPAPSPVPAPVDAGFPSSVEAAPQAVPTPIGADSMAVTPAAFKVAASDPVAQVADRVLDVARDHAWLDLLASDIVAAQDETKDLRFRLVPPQLGQLDVRIETPDSGMQLSFQAQSEEAAQLVSAAQPRLMEELRAQGVRVSGSEVMTSSGQNYSGGQSQRQPPQQLHDSPLRDAQSQQASRHPASVPHGRFA